MNAEMQAELIRRYPRLFREPGFRCIEQGASGVEVCVPIDTAPFDVRRVECGDGWFYIIDRLSCDCESEITMLIARGVGRRFWPRIAQIKEKFGGLRFYVNGSLSPQLRSQIMHAEGDESESFRTCECCGAKGRLRDGSHKRTRCDTCFEEELTK